MKPTYELYVIENTINQRKYVGITTWGYKRRFIRHKSDANTGDKRPLYRSMRKHSFDKFKLTLLCTVESWELLCELESTNIDELSTFIDDGGYNLTRGGEGTPGRRLSEEHKNKIITTRANWSDKKKQEVRDKQSKGVQSHWDTVSESMTQKRNRKISVSRKEYIKNRGVEESQAINKKIRDTLRKQPSKRRSCVIDDVEYFSQSEASRILNINNDTLRNRIKSKNYPNYKDGKLYVS